MKPFSLRVVDHPDVGSRPRKVLSIYLHRSNIAEEEIDGALALTISRESIFDAVHFVGRQNCTRNVSN